MLKNFRFNVVVVVVVNVVVVLNVVDFKGWSNCECLDLSVGFECLKKIHIFFKKIPNLVVKNSRFLVC